MSIPVWSAIWKSFQIEPEKQNIRCYKSLILTHLCDLVTEVIGAAPAVSEAILKYCYFLIIFFLNFCLIWTLASWHMSGVEIRKQPLEFSPSLFMIQLSSSRSTSSYTLILFSLSTNHQHLNTFLGNFFVSLVQVKYSFTLSKLCF